MLTGRQGVSTIPVSASWAGAFLRMGIICLSAVLMWPALAAESTSGAPAAVEGRMLRASDGMATPPAATGTLAEPVRGNASLPGKATVTLTITVTGTGSTFPAEGSTTYTSGDQVNLSAIPTDGSGWAFDHWAGDASGTNPNTQITMDTDKTVEAVFVTPGDHTLTMQKTGVGVGTTWPQAPGVYSFLSGRTTFVNANPDSGNYFGGWTGDLTGYNPSQQITMNGDKTVSADFTTSGYALTVNVTGTGYVNFPTGQAVGIATGGTVELSASPAPGYAFTEWQGDIGGADPSNATLQVTMDQPRTVTAVFTVLPQFQLTINTSGTGTGTTNPAPGVHAITAGQNAYITALPNPDSAFDHWEGDIGGANPAAQNITLTMDQDRTITAVFSLGDWTLTIAKSGNGDTNPPPGSYNYMNGATVSLNANLLAGGDAFNQWTGDLMAGGNAQSSYQQLTMNQNRSVAAEFIPGDWTLTLGTAGSGIGMINPGTGVFAYLTGRTAYITAYTSPTSFFAGWTGDVVSDNPSANITMDSNKAVTANYLDSGYTLTVNVDGQGYVNPTGTMYFASGAKPVLTINPVSGHAFDGWTGDLPEGADPMDTELPVLMDQNRNLTAHFIQGKAVLTLIIEGEGSTTPASAPDPGLQYEYAQGEVIQITAELGTNGWAFSHWSGDLGGSNPSSTLLTITMDQARTITAHYVAAQWTLTLALTGAGGIAPPAGTYGFTYGSTQRIQSLIYAGGDAFNHWEGLPGGYDPSAPDQTLSIEGDLTINAVFTAGDYTLTTAVAGGGTADYLSHPAGVYQYMAGRTTFLEVTPNAASYWGGFSGDLVTFDFASSLLIDANKSVTCNLATAGYRLTVNQAGGGSTSPSGTFGYTAGATPVIHAIHVGNKVFTHWAGDVPSGVDATAPDPVIPMDQNRTLTATFEPGDWYLYLQVIGGGFTIPPPGQYWFLEGSPFEVTAVPGADVFAHWQGAVPEGQDPAALTISGTMTQNVDLIAVFRPTTVTVPNLSGKTQAEAEAILAYNNLLLGNVTSEYNSEVPVNQVFDQTPAAGIMAPFGSSVDIVVSLGSCYTMVPNLVTLSQEAAETALTAAHLILGGVTQEYNDLVPEGSIVEQNPVYGLVILCDTPVDIVVSLGGCYVSVPNLEGFIQEEAATALESATLILGMVTQEYSDTVPEGHVIRQNPLADSRIPCHASVNIVLSLGPPPEEGEGDMEGIVEGQPEGGIEGQPEGVIEGEGETEGIIEGTEEGGEEGIVEGGPEGVIEGQPEGVFEGEGALSEGEGGEEGEGVPGEGEGGTEDRILMVDQNGDHLISLSELLRIIQFFNSDGLHCAAGTEDGYAPGPGDQSCTPYDSDYLIQDWHISLSEFLRVVQFFNSRGYHYCPGEGTEDGYCPGVGAN